MFFQELSESRKGEDCGRNASLRCLEHYPVSDWCGAGFLLIFPDVTLAHAEVCSVPSADEKKSSCCVRAIPVLCCIPAKRFSGTTFFSVSQRYPENPSAGSPVPAGVRDFHHLLWLDNLDPAWWLITVSV